MKQELVGDLLANRSSRSRMPSPELLLEALQTLFSKEMHLER